MTKVETAILQRLLCRRLLISELQFHEYSDGITLWKLSRLLVRLHTIAPHFEFNIVLSSHTVIEAVQIVDNERPRMGEILHRLYLSKFDARHAVLLTV